MLEQLKSGGRSRAFNRLLVVVLAVILVAMYIVAPGQQVFAGDEMDPDETAPVVVDEADDDDVDDDAAEAVTPVVAAPVDDPVDDPVKAPVAGAPVSPEGQGSASGIAAAGSELGDGDGGGPEEPLGPEEEGLEALGDEDLVDITVNYLLVDEETLEVIEDIMPPKTFPAEAGSLVIVEDEGYIEDLAGYSFIKAVPDMIDEVPAEGAEIDLLYSAESIEIVLFEADGPPWTVTFLNWYGELISEQLVDDGDSAAAPAHEIRAGYDPDGWDTDFSVVREDLVVTALYKPTVYNITYSLGGGTNDLRNPSTYTIEDTPIWFYSPTRAGYQFIGWTNGVYVPGGTTGNLTLTAQWVQNDCGSAVMVDENTGFQIIIGRTANGNGQGQFFIIVKDGPDGHIIDYKTGLNGPSGSTESAIIIEGAGYVIKVLFEIHGNEITGILPESSIESYPVRYDPGTWGDWEPYGYTGLKLGDPTPGPEPGYEASTSPGWSFAGWSPAWSDTVTGGVVYVAQWTAHMYSVTYAPGTHGTFAPQVTNNLIYNDPTPAAPTPTGEIGYTFAGWSDGTNTYPDAASIPASVHGTVVYTALWDEEPDVTINYAATTGGSVSPGSENVAPASGTAAGSLATADPGYEFTGWTSTIAGDATALGNAAILPLKNGGVYQTVTYTANFTQKPDVTITYATAGNGTVTLGSESVSPATGMAQGSTATASPGYEFSHWTTSLTPDVTVLTGETVSPLKNGGVYEEVTYTAVFTEKAGVLITYTTDGNGSVSLASETVAPATGTAAGSKATANAGFTFSHWTSSLDPDATDLDDETVLPLKNGGVYVEVTYTAVFTEDPDVTISYVARTGGSVSLGSETIPPATGTAQGSTATASPGYTFANWTDEAGNVVGSAAAFTPSTNSEGIYEEATYYANFTENADVTINYAATAGGSVSSPSETVPPATGTADGSTATADPGYTFTGWTSSLDPDATVLTGATVLPEKNGGVYVAVTYTAVFTEDSNVTISYEARTGGSVSPGSESVAPATGTATGSTATAAPGYTFANWTNEAGDEVGTAAAFIPSTNSEGIYEEATYYANFTENANVTITYTTDGNGTVSSGGETVAPATGTAAGSTATANPGYTFSHWTTSLTTDATVLTGAMVSPAKNGGIYQTVTYTAVFTQNPDVTINYTTDGNGTVSRANESVSPATGTALGSTATADPGYEFTGWTSSLAPDVTVLTGATVTPQKNGGIYQGVTYTAHFTAISYTIEYVLNDAPTSPAANGAGNPDNYTIEDTALAIADATRPGYTFLGWTSNNPGGAGPKTGYEVPEGTTGNITLTAHWEVIEYSITYVLGGGTNDAGNPATYIVDDTPIAIGDPSRLGYTFAGWTSNNPVNSTPAAGYSVPAGTTGNITLTAHWTAIPYTVTVNNSYAGNTGAGTYNVGNNVTIRAGSRAGYVFTGWTVNSGGATLTNPGNATTTFTMPAGNVTVTANWEKLYNVFYNGNGNSGGTVPTDGAWYRAGQTVTVKYGVPTRAGYTFSGWLYNGTIYAGGNTFVMPGGNVTLVAQWTPVGGGTTTPPGPPEPPTPPPVQPPAVVVPPAPAVPPAAEPDEPPLAEDPPDEEEPAVIEPVEPPLDAVPEPPEEKVIEDEPQPKSDFGAWALLNLILTIVTGLIMIALIITYFFKRKKEDEEEGLETAEGEDEDEEKKVKRHLGLRLITVAATIIAIILFVLTEDMSLPMGWLDQWTIWHVIIVAATVILAIFSRKKYEDEEEEDEAVAAS